MTQPAAQAAEHGVGAEQPRFQLGWFHRYPARFAPVVIDQMLTGIESRLGRAPTSLLDPFAGTGAAVSAGRQLGIDSTGIELSHMGVLIGRVRLWPPATPRACIDLIERWRKLTPTGGPFVSAELREWIGPANATALSGYLAGISATSDPRARRFLALSLSAALRPSSRWLAGSIKPQIDPDRKPSSLMEQWLRAARSIARDCELETPAPGTDGKAKMLRRDATDTRLPSDSFDAVLTSPPYFITYDYFDVHRLSHLAFGWPRFDADQVGQRYKIAPDGQGFRAPDSMGSWYEVQFRAERSVEGRALRAYLQKVRTHLREIRRVLRPGGVACYAVANSTRNGKTFELVRAFEELLTEAGFIDVESETRDLTGRRILPLGRDAQTGRFSSQPTPGVQEQLLYARNPS